MRTRTIIIILILVLALNSCFLMPLGAPHGHKARNLDVPDSIVAVGISCLPHNKYYVVHGTQKSDSVYISCGKMKQKGYLPTVKYGDSSKSYGLRIGDGAYHRKLLNDTIFVKIVHLDASYEIHKFLIVKDGYIRN